MVSSVQDEVASDKSEQRKIEDSIAHESQSNLEGNTTTHSELPRKESGNVQDEAASGKLGQRRIEDSIAHESQFNLEGNTTIHSELPRKESDNVQRTENVANDEQQNQSFDCIKGDPACQSSQKRTLLLECNVANDEQQNQSFDCIKGDPACQSSQKRTLLLECLQQGQSTDITSGEHTFETKKKGYPLSVEVAEVSDNLQQRRSFNIGVHGSQSSKGGSRLSSTPEKVPDQEPEPSLNTGLHMLQCDHQVRTFSRIPDKPLEDGYNWRKYGQKLVKGNEYVRSYYRCTHPNCAAKRQVERSQDGQISDTVYLGKHEHVKPQTGSQKAVSCVSPIPAIRPDECSLATGDDLSSNAHGPTSHEAKPMDNPRLPSITPTDNVLDCSNLQPNVMRDEIDNNGDPHSKRQKRDICDADETSVEKPNGEPRVVVQTMSEVDILNDGYRWRKYGQKLVKGNPNPRSYYRCSSAGCPVKKHVERASHDPKVVITTYEGQHDHDMPPARTVTANRGGANANMTDLEDGTTSKPDEKSAVGLEMVVHISAN